VVAPHPAADTASGLAVLVPAEYDNSGVFPPLPDLYAALRLCPPDQTRVLILGQDPYHRPGQAHGLSFSVRPGVAVPPSLRNVYKEIRDDLGLEVPPGGTLTGWAEQGVLLLNAVLTVRAGPAASPARAGRGRVTRPAT